MKRALETQLPVLIMRVETLLSQRTGLVRAESASPAESQPPKASKLLPARQRSAPSLYPSSASSHSKTELVSLPKLPPPPSPSYHRSLASYNQHQHSALIATLGASISSDEDDFNPFPPSPMMQDTSAVGNSHTAQHQKYIEGLNKPPTVPRFGEDLLCSPRLPEEVLSFGSAADQQEENKAKESSRSSQFSLSGDQNTTLCPICNSSFSMEEIEKHASACLDQLERKDKGEKSMPSCL